jgi:hypothetical protein
VTCSGNATACGETLQDATAAAADGATLLVCPGANAGGFSINTALTIIGAGEGKDPTTNTVLDGGGSQRVVHIPSGTGAVARSRLHITGGGIHVNTGRGAGLYAEGPRW